MNSQRFLLAGIVGGVVFFLLGWLLYGMLLVDFFNNNLWAANMMKTKPDPMWALIIGQLLGGFFFAYVIGKANIVSAGGGALVGFVAGLLICLSFDLTFYGVGNFYGASPLKGIAADAIVSAIIAAITGGAIGWVYGMKKAVAPAAA
jgi:hypothetical protein